VKRFAAVAFSALVVATVAAFFVTQHLKVSTPLIAGAPRPVPAVINPYGTHCNGVDHSRMRISFYLQNRTDDVSVYVVDASGTIVRTLASGRHMRKGVRIPDGEFSWNGREDNGSVAPDGPYYVRVALLHQGRTADITDSAGHPVPFRVKTVPPRPRVTAVEVRGAASGSAPVISPPGTPVTIHYTGTEHRNGFIQIYRTDLPGRPRIVKSFKTRWNSAQATWDGLIDKQPAPQGTYLVGMRVKDAACNVGVFPPVAMPSPGSTAHAGVTVRHLAAQPPLPATPAGSRPTVYVDASHREYAWTLWRAGARKPSAHGSQQSFQLRPKLPPAQGAGLYHLVITAGADRTDVPLIADHPGTTHRPRILVVLPALTWQGENPVDDPPQYDGIPNTLANGGPVLVARPLVNGLPAGYGDEAALLAYLDRAHLAYDLTTDLGLVSGTGPRIADYRAVVLGGSETWLPSTLASELRSYVLGGGHVLSLGTDSMLRRATVQGGLAQSPSAAPGADAFGARPGPLVSGNHDLILVVHDGLRLFSGTSGGFSGYRSYQPIAAPSSAVSAAGVSDRSPAIVGFRLGRGIVVEVGLSGFGASVSSNVDAKELVGRLWSVLGGPQ
jgi:hypothetical protein